MINSITKIPSSETSFQKGRIVTLYLFVLQQVQVVGNGYTRYFLTHPYKSVGDFRHWSILSNNVQPPKPGTTFCFPEHLLRRFFFKQSAYCTMITESFEVILVNVYMYFFNHSALVQSQCYSWRRTNTTKACDKWITVRKMTACTKSHSALNQSQSQPKGDKYKQHRYVRNR